MTFKDSIRTCLTKKYFSIEGRASNSEYWYFALLLLPVFGASLLFSTTLAARIFGIWSNFTALNIFFLLVLLALLIPAHTVWVRRIHDQGYSFRRYIGAVAVLGVILVALDAPRQVATISGVILTLFFTLPKGTTGENKFGPDPTLADAPPPPADPFWRRHPYLTATPLVLFVLAAGLDFANRYTIADYATVHPDGSLEYTLRSIGKDRSRGTDDDEIWALRFDAGLNVEPAGLSYWRKFNRSPRYQGTLNSFMRIMVSLPDFGNVGGHFHHQKNTTLMVEIWSIHRDYEPKDDLDPTSLLSSHEVSDLSPFRPAHDQRTMLECRKDKEIAPGLFRLREPTEAEIETVITAYGEAGENALRDCKTLGSLYEYYAVYNTAQAPLGLGYCKRGHASGSLGTCKFKFWLPQKRLAIYQFDGRHLLLLDEIHAFTTDLLANATLAGKTP